MVLYLLYCHQSVYLPCCNARWPSPAAGMSPYAHQAHGAPSPVAFLLPPRYITRSPPLPYHEAALSLTGTPFSR